MTAASKKPPRPGIQLAIDYGPLIVYFLAYRFLAGPQLVRIMMATGIFMVAIVVALILGKILLGRVSPTTWFSGILILFFGGVTIYLHDPKFIQMKPTIIYLIMSGMLFGGLALRKPVLNWLFGQAFPGLNEAGWNKLTRNWALYFLALAGANEVLRATLSFDAWLTIKVWGATTVSFLFALANMPMLLRHGLSTEPTPTETGPVE